MWINGEHAIAFWCLAIILTLIPYAMFNLSVFGAKWKVFMGDSGSTLIGFTIIWMLLLSTQGQGHAISPITGLWLIAVPLIDMVAVIFRRLKKGKSPFRPDRLHLHHLLMRAGLTSRQALLGCRLCDYWCTGRSKLLGSIFNGHWLYRSILPLCLQHRACVENHPLCT